jgi:formimidoylglutamate deiminase
MLFIWRRRAGRAFGIGSDSNVLISRIEELRARRCISALHAGGAQVLGRNAGAIAVGQMADLVAIDSIDPTLCALDTLQLLNGPVFAVRDRDRVSGQWGAIR